MPEPRFNHVAVSVTPDMLDPGGRKELVDFYSTVFGWQELPTETLDRQRLVLSVHRIDQFLFIHGDENPLRGPRMDHFGIGVDTEEELDTFLERARAYQAHDPRVDIIDKKTETYTTLAISSFYVGFLLPLMVEVQHWRRVG